MHNYLFKTQDNFLQIFDHQNILNEIHIWIEYYSILKAVNICQICRYWSNNI